MVIQVTLRQLYDMLMDSYINSSKVPCTQCGTTNSTLTHELRGQAEIAAERIIMNNLRKDDYKPQQS